jgi:hypothetical protein
MEGLQMLDQDTLALLIAISDLTGKSHAAKHVNHVYENAKKAAKEYLQSEAQFGDSGGQD